jgi:hypothetical protein
VSAARVWLVAAAAMLAAGCGASKANGDLPDAAPATVDGQMPQNDAPAGCHTYIDVVPSSPAVGDVVTITGHAINLGSFPRHVMNVWWNERIPENLVTVTAHEVGDGYAVDFTADKPGTYIVHYEAAPSAECQATEQSFPVSPTGANVGHWRVRITPPAATGVPAQELSVVVSGGTNRDLGVIQPYFAEPVHGSITEVGTGTPIAAYLRLSPASSPDTPVEVYSSSAGVFIAHVLSTAHEALIVPDDKSLAPARITTWQPGAPDVQMTAGDPMHGTIVGPDSKPLAGATIALAVAGVPATVATSDATGAWSALGRLGGGAIDVLVVPPEVSGLPRLALHGATFDASQAIAIEYDAAVATVDLGGTPVIASGAAAPGARLTFTGAIASAGHLLAAGNKSFELAGTIQVIAHADGAGALLAQRVPKAAMIAVVEPSPAVAAVVAVDASGAKPASIAALPSTTITGVVTDPAGVPRARVNVRLTPIGALAAGTPMVPGAATDASGHFSIVVAQGGHYALEATDPPQGYAEVTVPDVSAGDLGALALGPAIALTGIVRVGSSPLRDASLTLLCSVCTGVERSRPRATAVSDDSGSFRLAVPDPGITKP